MMMNAQNLIATCILVGSLATGGGRAGDEPIRVIEWELPEGHYRVTVELGDEQRPTTTWIKAEGRRLMLHAARTRPGEKRREVFTVNIRTPRIDGRKDVKINERETNAPRWDNKLSLAIFTDHPGEIPLEITPVADVVTVYVAGDSTVTDQEHEPWAGWAQMLPSFFGPDVSVANHAESGLSLRSFDYQRRLAKVLRDMKPGDYLFIQFGHNDQKEKPRKEGEQVGPFGSYKASLTDYVDRVRAKGGLPVLVTSMERMPFDYQRGRPRAYTLGDYAHAVRQVGKERDVPVIDLQAMSIRLYAALGDFEGAKKAFNDGTHHNVYGAYQLARCVVEGIKAEVPALARHLRPNLESFDPATPDADVNIPPSPNHSDEKPAGN